MNKLKNAVILKVIIKFKLLYNYGFPRKPLDNKILKQLADEYKRNSYRKRKTEQSTLCCVGTNRPIAHINTVKLRNLFTDGSR
jgi:hypothetical protein